MIIPIAIDLSEHSSIPEYQHDSADFLQLSKNLGNNPFILLHDGLSIEHSHFYQQINALPQKSRDAFIRICKKIPRHSIADWDGTIEPTELPSISTHAQIVALSKAKFYLHFEYDEDEFKAFHPFHADIECALWKAIEHTHVFEQMKQRKNASIAKQSLRSTLWKERFEGVIASDKWKRIKIVDRYLFLDDSTFDFEAIDFLLGKLNKQLMHPTEIEIFVQTNKYKVYDHRNHNNFDYFPEIVSHLQQKINSSERIHAIRIYAVNNQIGSQKLHDRYLYVHSTRELLCAYNIGVGFKVMREEYIQEDSTFDFTIYNDPSAVDQYKALDNIKSSAKPSPDYTDENVKVYIVQ